MDKQKLKKNQGTSVVRLWPEAKGSRGETLADDWTYVINNDDTITVTNARTGQTLLMGLDLIDGWDSDAPRGPNYGFLKHHADIRTDAAGQLVASPRLSRPFQEPEPQVNPLVVSSDGKEWEVTWHGRDGELHMLKDTDHRQLLAAFVAVCDALRTASGREPQFDSPEDIRHEVVYGVTPDHRAKFRLLGGKNGQPATGVLVLTGNPAGQRTFTGDEVSEAAAREIASRATSPSQVASRETALARLAEIRSRGIDDILNRSVTSTAEQDKLDADRQRWKTEALEVMREAGCTASEMARVDKLGTFTPQNLSAQVSLSSLSLPAGEQLMLHARNKKHRREMAERLDRLLAAMDAVEKR